MPLKWLHVTVQGVGFTDVVDRADVDRIVAAVRKRCATLKPFSVAIGPARVDPESIQAPVLPVEPLAAVRQEIRAAIGDVWGVQNVPEKAEGYRPHVSLAYSNTTGTAETIAAALVNHGEHVAEVAVSAVSLIDLNRDDKVYEWTEVATAPLGTARG